MSMKLTPLASSLTRACPSPGSGVGTSSRWSTSGPPGSVMRMAFIELVLLPRLARQRAGHNTGKGMNEQWQCVQGLGASELDAVRLRLLASAHLDVIQDFQMVRQELHRCDEHVCVPRRAQLGHQIGKVGFEPRLRRMAGALIAELPAFRKKAGERGDVLRRLMQVGDVVRLLFDHP